MRNEVWGELFTCLMDYDNGKGSEVVKPLNNEYVWNSEALFMCLNRSSLGWTMARGLADIALETALSYIFIFC